MYGHGRESNPTHYSTPTRHGLKGVRLKDGRLLKLETIRVAGRLMTSRQAVLRFFEAQNTSTDTSPTPPAPTPKQQKSAAAKASREADKLFGSAAGGK
jgi:hypothetical protein